MKNKEKYLTNFSEAKRKEATQKYNIIKPLSWEINLYQVFLKIRTLH